jgi:LPS-assembly lipoprotein
MTDLKRRLATGWIAAAVLTVGGCGFRLRGSGGQSRLPFATIHIDFPDTSALGKELIRNIRAGSGTQLVDDPKAAQAIVELLSESRDKAILSLNTEGRIREYALLYKVRFRVTNAAGKELLGPTEITLKRDTSFNESQVMSKEKEEELLYRDMQRDLVQQLLRRLAALKPA